MDVLVKITLIASVVWMGYSISEFVSGYKEICDKISEFKKMARENDADEVTLRRSNFLLSFGLSLGYIVLTYFSGLVYWIPVLIALKLLLSLYESDSMLVRVSRTGEFSKKFYMISKVDSLLNALVGLAVALVLVF